MSYYDYRAALLLHAAQYIKQSPGLLWSKHCCRLVKYQYVAAAVEDLEYLHSLLFADRHAVHRLVRVYVQPELLAQRAYLTRELA